LEGELTKRVSVHVDVSDGDGGVMRLVSSIATRANTFGF
jgi:hypothetical protein